MKLIKYLIIFAIVGCFVLSFGMISQGWEVGGVTWEQVKEDFLPTKQALEKKRDKYVKEAEKIGEP